MGVGLNGDIIFAQGIAHHFLNQGSTVVWPVRDAYFDGINRAYPKINWVPDSLCRPELFDIKEKIDIGGIEVAPIRWSDTYMKVPYREVMKAKYAMYDLPWGSWRMHGAWRRNFEKELELFHSIGLSQGESYNLVNTQFGSSIEQNISIPLPDNGNKNVEMKIVSGYSIFDWTKVIMEATEIHSVSTSLLYMLEVMSLTQPIHLYVRRPNETDFSFVEFLFTKNYILHP